MCCPLTHSCLPLQLTANEEEFLRTYAGVVNSQLSQLPQHSIDQGESRLGHPATPFLPREAQLWFLGRTGEVGAFPRWEPRTPSGNGGVPPFFSPGGGKK